MFLMSLVFTESKAPVYYAPPREKSNTLTIIFGVVAIIVVAELGGLIALVASNNDGPSNIIINNGDQIAPKGPVVDIPSRIIPGFLQGENICEDANPGLDNLDCIVDALVNVGPQAGSNVTRVSIT